MSLPCRLGSFLAPEPPEHLDAAIGSRSAHRVDEDEPANEVRRPKRQQHGEATSHRAPEHNWVREPDAGAQVVKRPSPHVRSPVSRLAGVAATVANEVDVHELRVAQRAGQPTA